jgi:curved DNA-binding protein CbpA
MRPAPVDYYEVLGLNQNASADEIKSAYRRLAIQHHPDKQGDVIKFKEINEANAVLGNPEKRADYDHQRANSLVEDVTTAARSVVNEYFRQFARA